MTADNNIPIRYIVPHGTRASLRIYWGKDTCQGTYHQVMKHLADREGREGEWIDDAAEFGTVDDYPDDAWPTACERCGEPVPPMPAKVACSCGCGDLKLPEDAPHRQVFTQTLYRTPDRSWIGRPVTGDCYWADWYSCEERGGHCIHRWENCDGKHLIVHLPGGTSPEHEWWDVQGRASNCDKQDDVTHRCWILHGRPEDGNLHVDKAGETCNAGGGSIDTGRWHGHLHNHTLVK